MTGLLGLCLLTVPASLGAEETASGTLFYNRLTDGTWQIWLRDLATGKRRQLTHDPGDKRRPAWGAQGRFSYQTGMHEAYQWRAGAPVVAPLLQELWPVQDLAWSPDGEWVAFTRLRTDLVDSGNLWVARADGSEARVITQEPGLQYHAAWSPDGQRLAYSGGHGYGTYELFVMNVDGSNHRQLTANQAHDFLPAWSPDGAWIAFSSDLSGDYEIWVIRPDGTGLQGLTTSAGLDSRPVWSPDGRTLAFVTHRAGTLELWVMNADGTEARVIERADGGVSDPAWRP